MLEKLQKKLASSSEEASIKNVISNGGYKKYVNVKAGSQLTLNEKAIEEDAKWDGFHGIAVSNSANLSVETALARYRNLWHMEEAFRSKMYIKDTSDFSLGSLSNQSPHSAVFYKFISRKILELMLRKKGIHLTPDRIRYALSLVHTTTFEDRSSKRVGVMRSSFTEDAEKIFLTLGISTDRDTTIQTECCA